MKLHTIEMEMTASCGKLNPPRIDDLLAALGFEKYIGHLKPCVSPTLVAALLKTDERQLNINFKFGVLHAKKGQTKEEEMFANIGVEANFLTFLHDIGDEVRLLGWTKYRAGLDIKCTRFNFSFYFFINKLKKKIDDITGLYSYYHNWHTHEIMYHVANCIPYNATDPQQLERKRQIGNDIVVVVFADDPDAITSVKVFRSHQNRTPFFDIFNF